MNGLSNTNPIHIGLISLRDMRKKQQKGFTFVEMIAALAIMITIVAIAVPMTIKFMEVQEIRAARTEMSNIFNDILFGDPKNGTFGFVGDVGSYPKSLKDLIENASGYTLYQTYTDGVKYGWHGPYSPDGENLLKDPWGEFYGYSTDTTYAEYAKITSTGPNKKDEGGNGDDLVYPIGGANIPCYGSLLVEVYDNRSSHTPAVGRIKTYYSNGGTESSDSVSVTCDSSYHCIATFTGAHVHHGLHCVQVLGSDNSILASTIATVIHGHQTKVTLTLR